MQGSETLCIDGERCEPDVIGLKGLVSQDETPTEHKKSTTTVFGFNWWPHNSSCAVLHNDWTRERKQQIAAEIDHMASLGVGVVRLMFWPLYSGFDIFRSAGNRLTKEHRTLAQHLPELLAMFAQRDIEVIVSFGNYHQEHNNPHIEGKNWQDAYGVTDAAFVEFLVDSVAWMDGIVRAVEDSPFARTVLYYDYQNELHFGWNNDVNTPRYASWYLAFMHDWSQVPVGKRGVSVLIPTPTYMLDMNNSFYHTRPWHGDASFLASVLGGRHLDYLEFHFYADQAEMSIPYQGVAEIYHHIKTQLPQTTVLIGESGAKAASTAEEDNQAAVMRNTTAQAVAAGLPYVLSWQFLDRLLEQSDFNFGVGYSADSPKDAMGVVASSFGLLDDGDMERARSSWEPGGSVTQPIAHRRFCDAHAATGRCYDRLQVDQAGDGYVWLLSKPVSVRDKSQLFVNAYLRASRIQNVFVAVLLYDGTGADPTLLSGSMATLRSWQWHNYLHHVAHTTWPLGDQSMSFPLPAGTVSAQVAIVGSVTGAPAMLDIDTVSAAAR